MQKILVAGALLLASVGIAGVASASDDCATAPIPGFYSSVCLFNDHTYASSYGYCDWFGNCYFYSNSGFTNQFASANAGTPFGGAGAGATDGHNDYYQSSCSFGWCSFYSSHSEFTNVGASEYTPLGYAGVYFNQYSLDYNSNGWPGSYDITSTGAYAGVPFVGAGASLYQYSSGSYCIQYVNVGTSFFGLPIPGSPCSVPAGPAGSVSTKVPQLYATCQNTGTPAGTVCARFPDMPDGTGLPFL